MFRILSRMGTLLCLIPLVFLILFTACDSSGGAAGITAADLAGTWMRPPNGPFVYVTGKSAASMIMEFSGSDYTMVFYSGSSGTPPNAQVGGNKGAFVVSGNTLVLNSTHSWNSTNFWIVEPMVISTAISLSGGTLTVTLPASTQALAKTVFTRPAALTGNWVITADSISLKANAGGTYEYSEPGMIQFGTWDVAESYSYLRTLATVQDGTPISYGFLNWYEYDETPDPDTFTIDVDVYTRAP